MRTSTCNCGATIHWAKTDRMKEDGSPVQIPLRRILTHKGAPPRTIYVVGEDEHASSLPGVREAFYSHFEDCPNAKAFSGRNARTVPPKETE